MNIFIGAKLNEEDLTKQGKSKELKEDAKEIKVQKEHILVFGLEKRKGKPVTLVGRFL
ncbi:MAG: translation initiation factor SUI1, partial [Campylobacteraceae bacterium]|nr:translation initiation factor SUI1 [Campylobacteraceae bacterium]